MTPEKFSAMPTACCDFKRQHPDGMCNCEMVEKCRSVDIAAPAEQAEKCALTYDGKPICAAGPGKTPGTREDHDRSRKRHCHAFVAPDHIVAPPPTKHACRLGAACLIHSPPPPDPWRPSVDEWDLLPPERGQ